MFRWSFAFFLQFIFICIGGIAARDTYRYDYKYYPDIGGWLKLHLIPATWRDAWLRCELEGSVLASPENKNMLLAMEAHWKAMNATSCAFYTGVHASFSKGDFSSIEGVPLAKLPVRWALGEPDDENNNEDCIVLVDGAIADVNCSERFPYMCYRRRTSHMFMTQCGTYDLEYELNPMTGNCYKLHRLPRTWHRAYMTCAAEGGHLAIVNSPDEARFLRDMFVKYSSKLLPANDSSILLIGMHNNWEEERLWRTIHGMKIEDAGYAVWEPGQPANVLTPCGALFRTSAKLDDWFCDRTAPFICEMTVNSLMP